MSRRVSVSILIAAAILIGSWEIGLWQPTADKTPEYVGYVDDLRRDFARQMLTDLNLVYSGDMGRMHGKVEEVGMKFTAYRRATIEEARALHLSVMGRLVQAVNAHEKLRPFLDERPFTYKRVEISISFQGPNGPYCDGSVKTVSNVSDLAVPENRNKLFYRAMDPFTGHLIRLFEEHHEEAVKRAEAAPPPNLREHQSIPLEGAVDEVLFSFAEEMQTKHDFECFSIGGKMTDCLEDIGGKFFVVQRATQEEARKLLLFTVEKLLHAINSDERLRTNLREFPFPTQRLRLCICFRKRNHASYSDGSMESVAVRGR